MDNLKQNSFFLFQSSTCFEQRRAHHQDNQLYQYTVVSGIQYITLCRWPSSMQVGKFLHTFCLISLIILLILFGVKIKGD
jgi:hypothetical protein